MSQNVKYSNALYVHYALSTYHLIHLLRFLTPNHEPYHELYKYKLSHCKSYQRPRSDIDLLILRNNLPQLQLLIYHFSAGQNTLQSTNGPIALCL